MSENNWKEITINTTTAVIDILSEFLEEKGSQGIAVEKFQSEDETILKAYFSEDETDINILVNQINEKLYSLSNSGFAVGKKLVSVNQLIEEDWSNDWKKYFEVFHVGSNLVIKPFWQEYSAQPNEVVIDFDPGGFFGSTPHPSTRLCLEEIEEIAKTINDKSNCNILDLGSGSGILSLALYHLGLKKITAIDIDPVAIRASEDNFKLNNMDVKLFLGDLKDCHDTYDFIAGNLLAEIIIELSEGLSEKLNKNGLFIAAGITRNQEQDVESALNKVGINIINKRYKDEWVLIRAIKS